MDIGAHDGKWINNTLYFEETHNWTGINVEPIPNVYAKLIINPLPGDGNPQLMLHSNYFSA